MDLLLYTLGIYVLVSVYVSVMIHIRRGDDWGASFKDGFTWPKLIPQMWS